MPFIVPAMPLLANGWLNYSPSTSHYHTPDATGVPCNLSPGKRVFSSLSLYQTKVDAYSCYGFPMELLLPKLQAIGVFSDTISNGLVEVPAGSGRLYFVVYVDDVGKGFANEHRFAIIYRVYQAMVFVDVTIPVPLPLT
jgi:hypothetical protein